MYEVFGDYVIEPHVLDAAIRKWIEGVTSIVALRGAISGFGTIWAPPDKLLFDKESDVYIADQDGSNPRKLVTVPDFAGALVLAPNGDRFRLDVVNFVNNTSAIWEARIDGSNLHPVFPGWNNPHAESTGSWTPDGR